ncbi:hypothetical protein [Gulosibacter faecalis]|jgi:hypothetical protein|uniref:ATP synthase protein I n=1 Tax=Gulosibacter faecalis TaxID=272240 RepID=A0ABW5UYK3_9MICO|nr:hypothetical protein [Gulosibacter faecalis]
MTNTTNTPTSVPVMKRVLKWSLLLTLAIAVVGGITGYLVAGFPGLWSALVAAGVTLLFTGLTVLSIILAARFDPMFFIAVILGMWLLKFVAFLGVLALVKAFDFTHDWVLWSTMMAAMVGQLAIDVIVVQRSRQPYVSDVKLPGEANEAENGGESPSA